MQIYRCNNHPGCSHKREVGNVRGKWGNPCMSDVSFVLTLLYVQRIKDATRGKKWERHYPTFPPNYTMSEQPRHLSTETFRWFQAYSWARNG